MNLKEAAHYLKVMPETLSYWMRCGKGPRGERIRRIWYFEPQDISNWLTARKAKRFKIYPKRTWKVAQSFQLRANP